MIDRRLFLILLTVILFASTICAERARNDNLQDEEDISSENNDAEDVIETVKRFLLKKKTTTTTPKPNSGAISALFTTSPRSRIITTTTSSIFGDKFGGKSSVTSRYGESESTSRYDRTRFTTSPSKDACGVTNPCKNGGSCRTLSSGRYYCFCTKDYYGKTCESKFMTTDSSSSNRSNKDHCSSSPCRNESECVSLRTTYYCRCKTPFYGTNCDKRLSKREEFVDESNSSEQDLNAYERNLEEDREDLRRAFASEDMIENIQ